MIKPFVNKEGLCCCGLSISADDWDRLVEHLVSCKQFSPVDQLVEIVVRDNIFGARNSPEAKRAFIEKIELYLKALGYDVRGLTFRIHRRAHEYRTM